MASGDFEEVSAQDGESDYSMQCTACPAVQVYCQAWWHIRAAYQLCIHDRRCQWQQDGAGGMKGGTRARAALSRSSRCHVL